MTGTGAVSYEGKDLEALFALAGYQRWIVDGFRDYLAGSAVEFGAGIGAITRHILPHVEHIDLVEPSPNLTRALEAEFGGDARVAVFPQTLETYIANFDGPPRNVAVLVNLLEHIEDDAGALGGIARILRPGGHILLFVPAMPFLFSRMDAHLGHFRRYTKHSLVDAVDRAGLDVVTVRYFDLLGILPWWIVNTLGGKTAFDPLLSRLYDRIGVPLTRTIERVIAPPVGKNLLLVARRGS